jgi:hypothetical protein
MAESNQDSVLSQVRSRVDNARGTVEQTLSDASESGFSALDDAVTVADESVDSASTFVSEMGNQTFDVLKNVLKTASKYIDENNLSITVSSDKVHLEGDSDGLRKVRTDLESSEKIKKGASVEFDREEGLEVEFRDPEQ